MNRAAANLAARVRAPHLLAGSLATGLAASLVVRSESLVFPFSAGAVCLAALALGRTRLLALAAGLALAGTWWGSVRLAELDASVLVDRVGTSDRALVEVTGPPRRSEFSVRVPVVVRRFGALAPDERARLELPPGRAPPQGALLEVIANVRQPRREDEPGGFDEEAYLRRQGIHVVLRASGFDVVRARGGIARLGDRLRRHVGETIAAGATGERRALVAGVVLGEDERLEPELRDDFRASGLYHLLAVSGQNVAYVVFGVLLAAWIVGLPRWLGHLGAVACVGAYVLAVGWQPSVVRAGIAGSLASLAWLAARPADRWYFLLVGACVLEAANPYAVLEPGFQLSFAAVAAIFVLVPRLEARLEGYPVPSRLASGLAVSVVCGVVTAPILWLHFGAVPVFSVLANALAAPVVPPLLGLALVAAALEPFSSGGAALLGWANGWLAAYLSWCAELVGGLPHAQLTSWRALLAVAVAVALAGLTARVRVRRIARFATLAAMLVTAAAGWVALEASDRRAPPPDGLRITFLDVGQGDATLVEVPEGAVLVDQGPPEARVAERLGELGVESLALVVLSHPSRDNIGGAEKVVEAVPVESILDPALAHKNLFGRPALAAARRRGATLRVTRAGQVYRLGALTLRVLWPPSAGGAKDDPNDWATVLLASYGEVDILLPADAESNVTLALRPPAVEVLKVGHHGSKDEGLSDLLELVRPRVAVVSVGRRNDYGHPAPSTLAALEAAPQLAVYRTDEHGSVVLETDGHAIAVRTDR